MQIWESTVFIEKFLSIYCDRIVAYFIIHDEMVRLSFYEVLQFSTRTNDIVLQTTFLNFLAEGNNDLLWIEGTPKFDAIKRRGHQ